MSDTLTLKKFTFHYTEDTLGVVAAREEVAYDRMHAEEAALVYFLTNVSPGSMLHEFATVELVSTEDHKE